METGFISILQQKEFYHMSSHLSKLDVLFQCYCRLVISLTFLLPVTERERTPQLYPSSSLSYVHGSQVCHQIYFLKSCVNAHVDAGTAGPHCRILPTAPSLPVAREVFPLEHTALLTLPAPTQGSFKASDDNDEVLGSQRG